jgi:CheY-like chemotaxis protein
MTAVHPPHPDEPEAETPEQVEARQVPLIPADDRPPVSLEGIRILIVEDDTDARAVLCRVLTGVGAKVTDVCDVPTALEAIPIFKPHVLISDVGIPEQDGYDFIRVARARGYSAEKLPAIALTAFARAEDRQRSIEAGFQLHLSKPVHAREIIHAIAALVPLSPKQKPLM